MGAGWTVVNLERAEAMAEAVTALKPARALISQVNKIILATGITVSGLSTESQMQSFALTQEIVGDPVCGSGCAATCLWHSDLLNRYGFSYIASQGMQVGRDSEVFINV